MFNREKLNVLESENRRLGREVEFEKSWKIKAQSDVRKKADEIERLRGFISLVADKLVPRVYRQIFGIPDYSECCATAESPNQSGHSPEMVVRNHIKVLEREAKEFAERQKIEQIVLDLKNRKWEPAE